MPSSPCFVIATVTVVGAASYSQPPYSNYYTLHHRAVEYSNSIGLLQGKLQIYFNALVVIHYGFYSNNFHGGRAT